MEWLDIAGISVGFVVGWIGAMVYYRELCSVAATLKMISLGVWQGRDRRRRG